MKEYKDMSPAEMFKVKCIEQVKAAGMEVNPSLVQTSHAAGTKMAPDVAVKFDGGKPPMELLPGDALQEVAKVLGFGSQKYAAHNWRKGFAWSRLVGAALRHITSWNEGENKDPESKISHLAHAACMILFLLSHEIQKLGTDDRYNKGDK